LSSSSDEQILAQEQAVVNRSAGLRSEIQSAMDVSGKETEGTLVLTNQRLLYVHGGEKREDLPVGAFTRKPTYFADVDTLDEIVSDPSNLAIRLSTISKVVGHHAMTMDPKLEVWWNDGGTIRKSEFVQQLTGASRRRNLNDWAAVMERLRAGKQKVTILPPSPDEATLEGKVLRALGDMQEKGLLTLELELEGKYGADLEPEDVESACEKLVSLRLVAKMGAKGEPPFYQKVSPLGDDNLES